MLYCKNINVAHTRVVISHHINNENIMFVCTPKIVNPDPDSKCSSKLNEKVTSYNLKLVETACLL